MDESSLPFVNLTAAATYGGDLHCHVSVHQGRAHDYRGQKRAVRERAPMFFFFFQALITRHVDKLLSCVSCVAVSDVQLPFLLCPQITVNKSLFTLS